MLLTFANFFPSVYFFKNWKRFMPNIISVRGKNDPLWVIFAIKSLFKPICALHNFDLLTLLQREPLTSRKIICHRQPYFDDLTLTHYGSFLLQSPCLSQSVLV